MRPLIKFILHASLVVAFIALMTAAFTPMARAEHDGGSTPYWLVIVDWDEDGKPFIHEDNEPLALADFNDCVSLGMFMSGLLDRFAPERKFVSSCVHPEENTLDEIIDMIIEDFQQFFEPKGIAI